MCSRDVEQVDFEYYDGKKWQENIVSGTIPFGIACELQLKDHGLIRRQFIVPGNK